jgi:NNP family nitrate/nitrite transporter-like MFS transporter
MPFLGAGHAPALFAAFLYFDMSFTVWVMHGPLVEQSADDLALTPAQKGLMVATSVSPVRCCASRWACWWIV